MEILLSCFILTIAQTLKPSLKYSYITAHHIECFSCIRFVFFISHIFMTTMRYQEAAYFLKEKKGLTESFGDSSSRAEGPLGWPLVRVMGEQWQGMRKARCLDCIIFGLLTLGHTCFPPLPSTGVDPNHTASSNVLPFLESASQEIQPKTVFIEMVFFSQLLHSISVISNLLVLSTGCTQLKFSLTRSYYWQDCNKQPPTDFLWTR